MMIYTQNVYNYLYGGMAMPMTPKEMIRLLEEKWFRLCVAEVVLIQKA